MNQLTGYTIALPGLSTPQTTSRVLRKFNRHTNICFGMQKGNRFVDQSSKDAGTPTIEMDQENVPQANKLKRRGTEIGEDQGEKDLPPAVKKRVLEPVPSAMSSSVSGAPGSRGPGSAEPPPPYARRVNQACDSCRLHKRKVSLPYYGKTDCADSL